MNTNTTKGLLASVEPANAIEEDVVVPQVTCADLGEGQVTADDINVMLRRRHKWCCWMDGCEHVIRFKTDQIEAAPFFIVRHLLRDHGMTPELVSKVEPSLSADVREYCEVMGPETPASGRAGVSTKMEMPR